jgi:Ca2+-binding EF-hand superfamily protein
MHNVLEQEYGISGDQAFGFNDLRDSGECTRDEFKRVLKIFFGDVVTEEEDVKLLFVLTDKSSNSKYVNYRDFCKYLSKKTVRNFKSIGGVANEKGDTSAGMPAELERVLRKEASLTYILRKSYELGIDLKKKFSDFDKSELNVIPRSKFAGMILDLPLGLNTVDV